MQVSPFFHRPSAVVFPKFRPVSTVSPPWLRRQAAAPRCVSQGGWGSSVAELERELSVEGEEWLKLGRLEEKCGSGGKGMVELLESLEREAIMGEDEGRDPTDYHRRAKIFSTSSRVFQALKQHSDDESEERERERKKKDEHVHMRSYSELPNLFDITSEFLLYSSLKHFFFLFISSQTFFFNQPNGCKLFSFKQRRKVFIILP
ncbi:uncharacterized protein LOC111447176 [Cucurbita moschata]|uniref:Uncharacterized protein LOC111447176 n=1 Tax=Cucurbita moschata TaxID=3662 RepID=A0A6J1FPZ7_CUCMO|nr:uncharacterized protein LOC111447176 [Cucurbita moschata]